MVYAQTRICCRKWDAYDFLELWGTNGTLNHSQKTRPNISRQEEKNCQLVDFTVPVDHRRKIKERKLIKIHRSCQRTERSMKHQNSGDTNCH